MTSGFRQAFARVYKYCVFLKEIKRAAFVLICLQSACRDMREALHGASVAEPLAAQLSTSPEHKLYGEERKYRGEKTAPSRVWSASLPIIQSILEGRFLSQKPVRDREKTLYFADISQNKW